MATAANTLTLDAPRLTPGSEAITSNMPKPNGNGAGGVSVVSKERRAYAKITQTNPLRKLKPDGLVRAWDSFRTGYLRDYALLIDAVAQWDDVLMSVILKREAAVKRLKWQVLMNEDVPDEQREEAESHKEALFNFYNNLTCTHALDGDVSGGFSTFVEWAMKCVGNFWSPFEILWQPTPEGLTAQFNYVPLWFFEKRTGKLRFLQGDFVLNGDELVPNGWVVFQGPGLMVPSAVCYIVKDLARQSYLCYCQNQGMPGIHGTTKAPYNSDQWNAMFTMLETVLAGGVILTGEDDKVTKLDISAQGTLPFPELIREQNERMATIWRGGSKGTISTGGPDQTGVNLQADEEMKLAADDGQRISSTLNAVVDKIVIEWTYGEGVKPLAYIKIAPPPTVDVDRDLKVFEWFTAKKIPLGMSQMREHFSVSEPNEGDTLVTVPIDGAITPAMGGAAVLDENGKPIVDPESGIARGVSLNGAQVTALSGLATQVAAGDLPMEMARTIALAAFPEIPLDTVNRIFQALKGFTSASTTQEATQQDVKQQFDKEVQEAGNEYAAAMPEILRRLNTPRNARALNALLKKGALTKWS